MYFRFGGSFFLVVAITLCCTQLEKENLALRRQLSRQHYQRQALHEFRAEAVLAAHSAGAPLKLLQRLEESRQAERTDPSQAEPSANVPRNPLLSLSHPEPRLRGRADR